MTQRNVIESNASQAEDLRGLRPRREPSGYQTKDTLKKGSPTRPLLTEIDPNHVQPGDDRGIKNPPTTTTTLRLFSCVPMSSRVAKDFHRRLCGGKRRDFRRHQAPLCHVVGDAGSCLVEINDSAMRLFIQPVDERHPCLQKNTLIKFMLLVKSWWMGLFPFVIHVQ